MRVVHISGVIEEKPRSPTKKENKSVSARRWVSIQNQRNYRAALKEFDQEIKEIQRDSPGWLPIKY